MHRKIAPMWQVGEVLFHYSDEFRANSKGEYSLVWVVMDKDYFIGTEQLVENFAHAIFNSENDAEAYINE